MALWDDLLAEVIVLTNRRDRVAETGIFLRKAVRDLHNAGRFWRDLASVTIPDLPQTQVQEIDLSVHAPLFRKAASLAPAGLPDNWLTPVGIDEMLDVDNYIKPNIYWGFGNAIRVRASTPQSSYILQYWAYPAVTPTTFNSWIAANHRDAIVVRAAAAVLRSVNEAEQASRLETLAATLQAEVVSNNTLIEGH